VDRNTWNWVVMIEDEDAYDAALAEATVLMDAEPDTPEGARLDTLVRGLEEYEARAWPMNDTCATKP
jgi:antitoxin component HigA of HigAB toxin-antitoxin module